MKHSSMRWTHTATVSPCAHLSDARPTQRSSKETERNTRLSKEMERPSRLSKEMERPVPPAQDGRSQHSSPHPLAPSSTPTQNNSYTTTYAARLLIETRSRSTDAFRPKRRKTAKKHAYKQVCVCTCTASKVHTHAGHAR